MTSAPPDSEAGKTNRRRVSVVFLVVGALVLIAGLVILGSRLIHSRLSVHAPGSGAAPAAASLAEAAPTPPVEPRLTEHKVELRPGMTIAQVLTRHGFTPTEADALYEQSVPVYDLRRLRAGQDVRLFADTEGKIQRLEYDISDAQYISVEKRGERFEASLKERALAIQIREVWGVIKESLILSFNELGEEDPLALAFAELFGWDVDFYMDLRRGDTFKVVVEKRYIEGRFVGYGDILAAELVNQGKVHRAFHFVPPDTQKPGYYDEAGASLEKEFRRSPVKYGRITSRFSSHRLHPILHIYTAHYGVDFAAPIGTPIQATADGTVEFADWNGGAGRMVRLRHRNNYETMYFHLDRFAAGIRPGVRVRGGEVIGYVGSSGESTGPHVDYRILRGGGYLNPLSARFEPVEPLKPELLEDYRKSIEGCRLLLDDPLVFISRAIVY